MNSVLLRARNALALLSGGNGRYAALIIDIDAVLNDDGSNAAEPPQDRAPDALLDRDDRKVAL